MREMRARDEAGVVEEDDPGGCRPQSCFLKLLGSTSAVGLD